MVGYIYQIINNETEQRYIGKTIDIQRRRKEHLEKLRQNKHINKKLQNAWNIYGEDAFSFVYKKYEIEDENELNELEINAIKEYDSYTNGYNLTNGGDGGNTRGRLSYEDYCIIYLGCQWKGMTEKISNFKIERMNILQKTQEKEIEYNTKEMVLHTKRNVSKGSRQCSERLKALLPASKSIALRV